MMPKSSPHHDPRAIANVSIHRFLAALACLVPEGKLDAIPEPEFIVDGAKVILDDVLGGADGLCDFAVLEPSGDKLDDSPLSFIRHTCSVALSCKHSCLP